MREGSRVVTAKNGIPHTEKGGPIRPQRHLALRGNEETSDDVLNLGGTAIFRPKTCAWLVLGLFCL